VSPDPEPEAVVHLFTLDLAVDRLAELERLLSPDEVARADRFAFPTLRARFVAARGQLREILGREQGLPPGRVPIATGRWGKPYVAASDAVRFNLSHSADRAVCATSSGRDVGIDIEQVPWRGDELGVGRLVFAPAELDALARLDGAARSGSFCRLWTCKEAICKADGRGLSLDPRSFEVPRRIWCEPAANPERPLRAAVHAGGRAWSVELRDAPEGFAIALAVNT
jgi:4'-phosphopantetheinyl transferase